MCRYAELRCTAFEPQGSNKRLNQAMPPLTDPPRATDASVVDPGDDTGRESQAASATVWQGRIIGLTLLCFTLVLLSVELRVELVMWATLLIGVLLAYVIYRDASYFGQTRSWPLVQGLPYVVLALLPGPNIITTVWYLLNRWEVDHTGSPVISVERFHLVRERPRRMLRGLYAALGSYLVLLILLTLILTVPINELAKVSETLAGIPSLIVVFGPIGVIFRRRYSTPARRKQYDYALRDLSIRLLPVLGFGILATIILVFLILPVMTVLAIGILALGVGDINALSSGVLFPLFLLPLAVALVLPLRALPWIRALPHLFQELGETLADWSESLVPFRVFGRGTSGEKAILPITGHDHTAVALNVTADLEMPGIFGYLPHPIEEIAPEKLPSSTRRGVWYLLPGYCYAAGVFTYFQYYPERAGAYAAQFPAGDAITVSLSLAGLPHSLVSRLLEYAGLAPETLSLGLLGLIVPAALMVPGAWHLALEYEGCLYRLHQRLGDGNHLLLLWGIHLVPVAPLVLGYVWLTERARD